jgi:hypothetical protein
MCGQERPGMQRAMSSQFDDVRRVPAQFDDQRRLYLSVDDQDEENVSEDEDDRYGGLSAPDLEVGAHSHMFNSSHQV